MMYMGEVFPPRAENAMFARRRFCRESVVHVSQFVMLINNLRFYRGVLID